MKKTCSEIFNQYGTMLLRLAIANMKNNADAEDVLQDVLVIYLKKEPQFHSEEHEKAWLIRTTVNVCKNRLKSFWFSKRREVDYEGTSSLTVEYRNLAEALSQLTKKERTIIHLNYYEGYTLAEIAKILEQNESTIRSTLVRSRSKLRKILKEEIEDEEGV